MAGKDVKLTITREMVHVLDTCVWIELIEKEPSILHDLVDLVHHSAITLAVTPTLRAELRPHDEDAINRQKKNWRSRVGELEQFVEQMSKHDELFGPDPNVALQFMPIAERLRKLIDGYIGDPSRDLVRNLLESPGVLLINETKDLHELVVQQGTSKKKPFGGKNSTADALIFFAVHRWACRNPKRQVCFHTLNFRDFSAENDQTKPHIDLSGYFSPRTSLYYSYGLGPLISLVKSLDVYDYYPRMVGGCVICGEATPIENISCMGCGERPYDAPDDEYYTLTPRGDGYLVDVLNDHDGNWRIFCHNCGRKTFHVERARLCSYHQYTSDKD